VQVTAEHLATLQSYNGTGVPMETLIAYTIVVDLSVCGGAILLDGGHRENLTKLVLEDCEIRNAHASHLGGGIFQVGTTDLEVTRTLMHTTSAYGGGAFLTAVGPARKYSKCHSTHFDNLPGLLN
jgi:hypothetical protein